MQGWHKPEEHLLSVKPAFSGVCGADKPHGLAIRVCPPQEVLRTAYGDSLPGAQALCEHALTGKMITSGVCGADRFRVPVIRVCPPQERVQN